LGKQKVSAQLTAFNTIEVLLSQSGDKLFAKQFESAITKSGFATKADQINAQFLAVNSYTNRLT